MRKDALILRSDKMRILNFYLSGMMKSNKSKVVFAGLALTLAMHPALMQAGRITADYRAEQNKQIPVKGNVKDSAGEPLIGVSVAIKGKPGVGTVTDIDGNFTLACNEGDILELSYIGYKKQEINPQGKGLLKVVLQEDTEQLDEVIVIGYGTTTRKSAVGAVSQVKSDMIGERPVANVTQALQGAAPGVIVQQTSYNPNDNKTNFNIRGISTLNDNSPLIVIDGLVSDAGSFNKLNPMDIENISILKDAGTAAIYGSRSANGVIVVTTKSGQKNEKPTVRLSGMFGWQDPDILFSPVAGYQNATLTNLANTNAGNAPKFTPEQIRDLAAHQSEESWFYDQIMRTALQQNYNLSVSGGSANTTYMVSMGYYDQESNYVGNKDFGVQRYNFRTNIHTEVGGRLKLNAILAYTRNNSVSTTGSSLEIDAERVPTYYYYKMKSADGRYLLNDVLSEFNPLGALEAGGMNKYRNNYLNANFSAELKLIDGLTLKGVLGADVMNDTRFTRNKAVAYYASEDATEPRPINKANNKTSNWSSNAYLINSQLLLNYNKSFGKHNVSGLLGVTNESYTYTASDIEKKYVDPDLGIGTDQTTEAGNITGSTSVDNTDRTSITSLLGRLGYNFADKYYGEFSFRYDGSSKFNKNYRWGFFPSFSAGWRISEEPFMETYKDKVGDLKLRASYGLLGSQAIGTYDRFTIYSVYNNTYAYNNSSVSGTGFTLGLDNLTWERTKTLNVGVDATLLKNLTLTFDYFYKRTTDILMKPEVPSVFGTSMPMDNIGKMQNQGWDLGINYNLQTGKVNHGFSLNLGDSFNKVLTFPGHEQITQVDELARLIREGVPLNAYYGYKTDGFFQSYEEIEASAIPVGGKVQPGDLKFKDRNNDGVIDSKDRYILT